MTTSQRARWNETLLRDGFIEFKSNKGQLAKMLFGCVGFSVIGLWFIVAGSVVVIVVGVVSALFFGIICGSLIFIQLVRGGPTVRVDREAIRWGKQEVRWPEIIDARTWSGAPGRAHMVVLDLIADAAARNRNAGGAYSRASGRANTGILGSDALWLPATNGFDPEEMTAWLNELRTNDLNRRAG